MPLNIFEADDSIITVDIAKKPFSFDVDTTSPFRKPELSSLYALFFTSLVALILFISTTNVYSAQVTFEWDPSTEPDIAGHKIYSGSSSRNYDNVNDIGNQTSYTIQNLVEGHTYYFTITAYNTLYGESGYSAEVVYTVPILDLTVPSTPTSISISQVTPSWNVNDTTTNDTTSIVTAITAGDIDGNGQDGVIIDYGPGNGIWARMNNDTEVKLYDLSPEIMTTGDMDGNGLDEVIIDFGSSYDIQILMNDSTWSKAD